MDSNHELDRISRPYNLLIPQSQAEVIKSLKSGIPVQNRYKNFRLRVRPALIAECEARGSTSWQVMTRCGQHEPPCFTPFIAMSKSASFRTEADFPRTSITSRQLP